MSGQEKHEFHELVAIEDMLVVTWIFELDWILESGLFRNRVEIVDVKAMFTINPSLVEEVLSDAMELDKGISFCLAL